MPKPGAKFPGRELDKGDAKKASKDDKKPPVKKGK